MTRTLTPLALAAAAIKRCSGFGFQTSSFGIPNVYVCPNDNCLPYCPENQERNRNRDPEAHISNQEVFDGRRRSLLEWYKARLSSEHHGENNELWFKYIAASGFHILRTIFGFLRSSISSGVALSNSNVNNNNGQFINHMWIDGDGNSRLYLPFRLSSSVDDKKMDLQVVSNFIYVVFNKRPLKEMENLSTIVDAADHWLDCTPRFFHNLYHFLPSFDPNKHCVEVVFNPPCLWSDHGDVLCFANRFARHACDEANNKDAEILDRLMTEMGFTWLDKVPDKGNTIKDWFDEFGGFSAGNTKDSKEDLLDWFGFTNIQDRRLYRRRW